GHVEGEPLLAQNSPGTSSLLDTGRGQINIGPAGEAVLAVPVALAVSQKNELVHGADPPARRTVSDQGFSPSSSRAWRITPALARSWVCSAPLSGKGKVSITPGPPTRRGRETVTSFTPPTSAVGAHTVRIDRWSCSTASTIRARAQPIP